MISGSLAYLFYTSVIAWIGLLPVGILYFQRWEEECIHKKQREFSRQFQYALESLSAALSVGYSLENAMREVKKELKLMYPGETMIVREFSIMIRQIELNMTAEQAWHDLDKRVELQELHSFVTVFALAKRSGGDSIAIIRNAIRQIGDKVDTEREIETVLAAKKLEFKVMSSVPLGIIGYMRISFPEFMEQLYGNARGTIFMTICLVLYGVSWKLGNHIIQIEV